MEQSALKHPTANGNGRFDFQAAAEQENEYAEIGTPGLSVFGGYITKAYNAKLHWPSCEPLYSRIWRSDPETSIVRTIFSSLSGQQRLEWELPQNIGSRELDEPTDDDKRLLDFAHSLTDDIPGGFSKWQSECNGRTSFYGFGVWEMPIGLRQDGWTAPDDDWASKYNDGLVGLRKIAFRDYSSFLRWEIDENNGDVSGFEQNDPPNPNVMIPIENLLHITYGDSTNPEGLATMEALWRLERILFQYQVIHGIGSEHTAGHARFTVEEEPDADGNAHIRRAARAILTAQEGSYVVDVKDKFVTDIMSTDFPAAEAVLNAIRYYSVLKLSLYGMQFVAMNTISGTGSYSALQDSSSMALLIYNSMTDDFARQASDQIGRRIFRHPINMAVFPNATRAPVLKASHIEKVYGLDELGRFAQAMNLVMGLGEDDIIAIRRKSGILPEQLPEEDTAVTPDEIPGVPSSTPTGNSDNDAPENLDTTAGLNGAQITAVLKVLDGVVSGAMPEPAAVELLVSVGMQRERAQKVISETAKSGKVGISDPSKVDESEMSMTDWWKLRREIYGRPELPHTELIERLDNATTNAELASIREVIDGRKNV